MLKAEKFKKEIESFNYMFAVVENKVVKCADLDTCENCEFKTRCGGGKIKWLLEEYEEPNSILTEKEKACLNKIIKPKRDSVIYIRKTAFLKGTENEFTNIVIATKGTLEAVATPSIPFEGMELEREYSLEELGL